MAKRLLGELKLELELEEEGRGGRGSRATDVILRFLFFVDDLREFDMIQKDRAKFGRCVGNVREMLGRCWGDVADETLVRERCRDLGLFELCLSIVPEVHGRT